MRTGCLKAQIRPRPGRLRLPWVGTCPGAEPCTGAVGATNSFRPETRLLVLEGGVGLPLPQGEPQPESPWPACCTPCLSVGLHILPTAKAMALWVLRLSQPLPVSWPSRHPAPPRAMREPGSHRRTLPGTQPGFQDSCNLATAMFLC